MRVLRTVTEVRQALEPFRSGSEIGLVPTMGAFHDGHVALFRTARTECEAVVVSLFVNPAQFAPGEDFGRYPRDHARDSRAAEEAGVDFLFTPSREELYPDGYATWVDVDGLSHILEGEHRPGHFRGVATVCLKLFNIVRPTRAYFGEKDAQQVAVVKRLVADLNLDLSITVVPTVRDSDGLALSSRNAYLSAEERRAAAAIPRALERGAAAYAAGGDPVATANAVLAADAGLKVDYLTVADFDGRRFLATAVRVGSTRLIDNVVLEGETH